MNEATFRKLDLDAVRDLLAGHCATALGKALARTLAPTKSPQLVRTWLAQVSELSEAVAQYNWPPLGGVHDVRDYVRAAAFPTPLEPDPLIRIADTLAATGPLCAWLTRVVQAAPSLQSLAGRVGDLTVVANVIRDAIDERGKVRDYATPRLADIRRSIEDARKEIHHVFERIVRHAGHTKFLQYSGATFHNDRYVLPLKAEYRGRVPGIIHRSSDSGATLFVEPSESVQLNNAIIRLREEEDKEITQVLRGLTQRIHLNAQPITETLRAIGVVDLIAAKCRYGKQRSCLSPEIDADGRLELHEARHPLLVELFADAREGLPLREVVPIDVRLGDDFDVLVVTGPNTGGKTVTIKTIGLLALMTQCGIPIPVGPGSRMPVFREIFIDVGDEQSLQQSLSTFSSHLAHLLEIIRGSSPAALVLIDELGAGTDPDEGAAIGRAVIAELLNLKAKAIVTTHLSALKAVAFTTPRVDNASVEFDPESLCPTFRLRMGEPGNSNALIIAKRLGMPARLIQLAKGFLDDRTRALNKAIEGTLDSRREAEAARKAARDAALEAQKEREGFEKERADLEKAQDAFTQWMAWMNTLKPGDPVYVKSVRCHGRVVRMQLHRQSAVVTAGEMDLEIPLRDLDRPQPAR
ncbi:MAG: endonuclease MutS2 [Planctomycetota bacterium]